MYGPLPSLKALRAFEAAARHLSFARASAELHVTPAAVSQQIKALEADLGEPLFVRRNRALSLTETGKAIVPEVRAGFEAFARAMQRLRERRARRVLKVASAPAFASKWLVTHLERFSARFPELDADVCIFAGHDLADYEREQIDIGIRYGRGEYPGLVSEPLMSDTLFPVCSPQLAVSYRLRAPADLKQAALLHDDSLDFDSSFPVWRNWIETAGVSGVNPDAGPRFNTASDAIAAAAQGAGVLLARRSLVAGDIAEGRLVRLFDVDFPLRHGFHLVYLERAVAHPEVAAFREWLLGELS